MDENGSVAVGTVDLSVYAEQAYLSYAMSVVLGRALPLVCDGQKPVQRRILYAMHRLGLTEKTKPVKCARFVGDILGKYHPHGDSSVYDASVRMAQSFSLRYPLVDGQGNFGSRDGDGAAAMRYTEARLTPYAELLLGELDQGTVDFVANYDGTLQEPTVLPARLPVLLLNGASGIAVGMATEIPSHNLSEVAMACERLIRKPDSTLADILAIFPGPDFPCGAQIISSTDDIFKAYATGRGAFRTRARWEVEPLARGQWQLAITELPPDTSAAKVLQEIDALTNPQIKAGKKALTQEQLTTKALVLSVVDRIGDDSDGAHPVRIIIEPRSAKLAPEEVMQVLLAHTSLEANVSLNLVTIGQDGKPQQKGLLQVLSEWVAFRYETVKRRTQHRLKQVQARSHILEGRLAVFLHLDDVIRIIREAADAKIELQTRFGLSALQTEDILEIRLRQLATLEHIKLEGELDALRADELVLQGLLADRNRLTTQVLRELAEDRKKYGDARRTLIEAATRITTTTVVATADDPLTLIISKQGWLRARTGHKTDLSSLTWKGGDAEMAIFETRTSQTLLVLDTGGRAYNVPAAAIPTGRGDGMPLTALVDMGARKLAQVLVLNPHGRYLLAQTGGTGFICPGSELQTRLKGGKAVVTLEPNERLLSPVALGATDEGEVAIASSAGKLLVCPLAEIKQMGKGRGVQLIALGDTDTVVALAASETAFTSLDLSTLPAGADKRTESTLSEKLVAACRGHRARAGGNLPYKAIATHLRAGAGPAA